MRKCSVENCAKISYGKGLCTKHYALWLDTGELPQPKESPGKDPDAVALGRKGGLKGGPERAKRLTPKKRSEIARKAANKRWGNAILEVSRVPEHGTANGYGNYNCRCKKCKAAHAEYMAKMNKRPCKDCGEPTWGRYSVTGLCRKCVGIRKRKPIKHGTETGYNNGCRCEECTCAASDARRKRRRRQVQNEVVA